MQDLIRCEQCDGTGQDSGALYQIEPCKTCNGYGKVLSPAQIESNAQMILRKPMGRVTAKEWAQRNDFRRGMGE